MASPSSQLHQRNYSFAFSHTDTSCVYMIMYVYKVKYQKEICQNVNISGIRDSKGFNFLFNSIYIYPEFLQSTSITENQKKIYLILKILVGSLIFKFPKLVFQ